MPLPNGQHHRGDDECVEHDRTGQHGSPVLPRSGHVRLTNRYDIRPATKTAPRIAQRASNPTATLRRRTTGVRSRMRRETGHERLLTVSEQRHVADQARSRRRSPAALAHRPGRPTATAPKTTSAPSWPVSATSSTPRSDSPRRPTNRRPATTAADRTNTAVQPCSKRRRRYGSCRPPATIGLNVTMAGTPLFGLRTARLTVRTAGASTSPSSLATANLRRHRPISGLADSPSRGTSPIS